MKARSFLQAAKDEFHHLINGSRDWEREGELQHIIRRLSPNKEMQRTLDTLKLNAYRRAFDADFAYLPAMPHKARALCYREDYPDAWSGLDAAVCAALNHPTN